MDSFPPKAALPFRWPLSSIKVYYGVRRWVVKFLTSKVFTTRGFQIKVGWVLPALKSRLEESKFSTLDVIQNLEFRYNSSNERY